MASGRELKIREQKRQQFQQKRRHNQIVQQLNQQQVVADTDTLQTIASNNGVDPVDILQANPELKNIQTGMVINLPRPGSSEWRAQNTNQAGGIGLPSNAALGGTTNNPQGNSYFQSEKLTTTDEARRTAYQFATPPASPATNWYQQRPASQRTATGVAGLTQSVMQQQRAASPASPMSQAQPTVINTALPAAFQNFSMMEENYHYNLLRKVNSPTYTPSEADLNYLQHVGLIRKKPPQPAYASGGGSRGRGRGGGGGGSRSSTGRAPAPQERLPAFSGGGGFHGLINWRI